MSRGLLIGALFAASACASFEDEDVVIDLRIIAMSATLPEQVIDATAEDLENPAALLEQIEPSEMCALVTDPSTDTRMRWELTLCVLDNNERCGSDVRHVFASGITSGDPDTAPRDAARPRGEMCGTIEPDGNLLGVVMEAFADSSISGLGGLDYGVALRVGPEDGDPADDLYAGKTVRVSPRIPAERSANVNPTVERFDISLAEDGSNPQPLPLGRCADQAAPIEVAPDVRVRIDPIETPLTRETYTVPTLDGETRTFTESPTYQWLVSGGGLASGNTGGTRDNLGNVPELHTYWNSPDPEDVTEPTNVSVWIVQRDERLGATWYESCFRVVP